MLTVSTKITQTSFFHCETMAALTQEVFIKTRLINKKPTSFKQNAYLKSSQFNTKQASISH
jgi:hypothetical protein